jgi:hypothetical protein
MLGLMMGVAMVIMMVLPGSMLVGLTMGLPMMAMMVVVMADRAPIQGWGVDR